MTLKENFINDCIMLKGKSYKLKLIGVLTWINIIILILNINLLIKS